MNKEKSNQDQNKKIDIKTYVIKIMPVGFLMALTLYLGNLAYLYLSVSLIQILKATTPVMTLFFLCLAKQENATIKLVTSVLIIACGTGKIKLK